MPYILSFTALLHADNSNFPYHLYVRLMTSTTRNQPSVPQKSPAWLTAEEGRSRGNKHADTSGSDVRIRDPERPMIDQAALNLASSSGLDRALTCTTTSTVNSPSYSYLHFRSISDSTRPRGPARRAYARVQGSQVNEEDGVSRSSTYSYRTDIDASRFLREVEGRVSESLFWQKLEILCRTPCGVDQASMSS